MPSIYQPRRPRASPLWQILTAAWDSFLAAYEKKHRPTLGPLRPNVFTAVRNFLRCGDRAAGFLRFHCPDCGHERLLSFTCKGRHLCPACHQRRVRQTADWIATAVCHEVPHRQFVFTIPKILRGIFRKRRDLLHLLFKIATETLQESVRSRLNLPDGKLGAIAAVHTFGDYRSKRHHTTKRNFEIFKAPDFIAAVIDHLPPKGKQTVRYYGLYSNKTRGQTSLIPDRIIRPPEFSPDLKSPISNLQSEILLVPAPPKQSARSMRPLWRDLILKIWGADPLQCPCCKAGQTFTTAPRGVQGMRSFH